MTGNLGTGKKKDENSIDLIVSTTPIGPTGDVIKGQKGGYGEIKIPIEPIYSVDDVIRKYAPGINNTAQLVLPNYDVISYAQKVQTHMDYEMAVHRINPHIKVTTDFSKLGYLPTKKEVNAGDAGW